jgi:hypothetical protein
MKVVKRASVVDSEGVNVVGGVEDVVVGKENRGSPESQTNDFVMIESFSYILPCI